MEIWKWALFLVAVILLGEMGIDAKKMSQLHPTERISGQIGFDF